MRATDSCLEHYHIHTEAFVSHAQHFPTFTFNIERVIQSALYCKQTIFYCARIKSQLQYRLTK